MNYKFQNGDPLTHPLIPEDQVYSEVMGRVLSVMGGKDNHRDHGVYHGQASLVEALVRTNHKRISDALLAKYQSQGKNLDEFVIGFIKNGEIEEALKLLQTIEPSQLDPFNKGEMIEVCFDHEAYELIPLIYKPGKLDTSHSRLHEIFFSVWSRLHKAGQSVIAEKIAHDCEIPFWRPLMNWWIENATESGDLENTSFQAAWQQTNSLHLQFKGTNAIDHESDLEALQVFMLSELDLCKISIDFVIEISPVLQRLIAFKGNKDLQTKQDIWKRHVISTKSLDKAVEVFARAKFYPENFWPEVLDYYFHSKQDGIFDTALSRYKEVLDNQETSRETPFDVNLNKQRALATIETEHLIVALRRKEKQQAETLASGLNRRFISIKEHDTAGVEFYYASPASLSEELKHSVHNRLKQAGVWPAYMKLKSAEPSYLEITEHRQEHCRPSGVDWHLARNNPAGALSYFSKNKHFWGLNPWEASDALKIVQADANLFNDVWENIKGQDKYHWRTRSDLRPLLNFLLGCNEIFSLDDEVWLEFLRVARHVRHREGERPRCHNELDMDHLFISLCQQGHLSRAWQLFQELQRDMSHQGFQSCLASIIEHSKEHTTEPPSGEKVSLPPLETPENVVTWMHEMTLQKILEEGVYQETQARFRTELLANQSPLAFRAWDQFPHNADLREESDQQAEAQELWAKLTPERASQRWRVLNKMIHLKDETVVDIIRSEITSWPPRVQRYFLQKLAQAELITRNTEYFLRRETHATCAPHVLKIFVSHPDYLENALRLVTVKNGVQQRFPFSRREMASAAKELKWNSLLLCLQTFGRIDDELWSVCQFHDQPEDFVALKTFFDSEFRATPNLCAEYVKSSDRNAFLDKCRQTIISFSDGHFDPASPLHIDLEFTRFKAVVEDEKIKHHVKNNFDFYDFSEIFVNEKSLDRNRLDENLQRFEIECVAHEAHLLKVFIDKIRIQAEALGRPLMVVPNLSYGYLPVAPMLAELEAEGVDVLMGTKVGSSESHDNPGVFNKHTFKTRRTKIMQQQPIIVVVDGTQHLTPRNQEGKSARYPDAYQGYLNHAIAINQALGQEYSFDSIGNSLLRAEKLANNSEFNRAVETYAKLAPATPSRLYDFKFWNTAQFPLVVRSNRGESQTILPIAPEDITGPTMIFCNVGVPHDQLPSTIKNLLPPPNSEGDKSPQHTPAFFDDSQLIIDLDFSYDGYGVKYTNQLERLVTTAYHRQRGQTVAERYPAILKAARPERHRTIGAKEAA